MGKNEWYKEDLVNWTNPHYTMIVRAALPQGVIACTIF
jgi:hypothetical protein